MLNLLKDCQLLSPTVSLEDDDDIKNWDNSFYLHYEQNHRFHSHNQHNHHAYAQFVEGLPTLISR